MKMFSIRSETKEWRGGDRVNLVVATVNEKYSQISYCSHISKKLMADTPGRDSRCLRFRNLGQSQK